MAGIVPNTGASYARQSVLDTVDLETIQMGSNLTGVVSGCATTTAGGVMTVAVAAGVVRVAGRAATYSTATSSAMTSDPSNPKWYLISITNAGVLNAPTAGTAAADPKLPAIPADSVVVSAVYLPAGVSAITAGMILDKRVTVADTRMGIIVAATDAPAWMKASAHFVCDGTADDVQIQAAIDLAQTYVAANADLYGAPTIYLTPGLFVLSTTVTLKTAPIVGMSVAGVGVRIKWDGSSGVTAMAKDESFVGENSQWMMSCIQFRKGSAAPGIWLDLSTANVDEQFRLSDVHFSECTAEAVKLRGWTNLHWRDIRFDLYGTYAITATTDGSQNLSTFRISGFTADSRLTTALGFIKIDNTANASNLGTLVLEDGRIEINTNGWSSPAAIVHLVSPNAAANARTIGIELANVTYQDSATTASDCVLYNDMSGGSAATPSLTMSNFRQSGISAIVLGTLPSGFPTVAVVANYGYVSLGAGSTHTPIFADRLVAEQLVTKVVAGAVSDASYSGSAAPPSGTIAIDTSNSKIYVRVGSTWKSVTVS